MRRFVRELCFAGTGVCCGIALCEGNSAKLAAWAAVALCVASMALAGDS